MLEEGYLGLAGVCQTFLKLRFSLGNEGKDGNGGFGRKDQIQEVATQNEKKTLSGTDQMKNHRIPNKPAEKQREQEDGSAIKQEQEETNQNSQQP